MERSNAAAISGLVGKKFQILDKGHVILMDVMGSDEDIVQAARTSFGKGTRSVSDDETLLRYLMRQRHSTPFEMAEIKLHVRVPMDTWRQWIRHRTANVNEYSTRYSEAIDDKQETLPNEWRLQSAANKQGSGGFVTEWPDGLTESNGARRCKAGEYLTRRESALHDLAASVYQDRLAFGVAREQARKDLPLSTYTEAVWKCDLRNTLGFLSLRMDEHAQLEIRSYASVIGKEIVAKLFPLTWQAFLDYELMSIRLSALDIRVVSELMRSRTGHGKWEEDPLLEHVLSNKRERDECRAKLERLGIL